MWLRVYEETRFGLVSICQDSGWVSEFRLPDKIAAIILDNNLAGQGKEVDIDDEISELLKRCTR